MYLVLTLQEIDFLQCFLSFSIHTPQCRSRSIAKQQITTIIQSHTCTCKQAHTCTCKQAHTCMCNQAHTCTCTCKHTTCSSTS